MEKLLALGDSASAEELYYLGVLHDDFGMGMPNDPGKARAYFKKSFDLGYADAGVGYVYVGTDEDEAPEPLSTEQRKLLEKAAKRGSIRAKAWLLIDDLVVCLKENASEEEIETAKQRYEQFLEKTESDDPFILLLSGKASLRNGVPTVRARGFEILLNLRNYWETDIADIAWVWIGECFRDGIYVSQDLDEAKFCFNKIVEIGKKEVSEEVREFLSGNWRDEPLEDEDAGEWAVGKMNEKLRQIEEALFFARQMWLYDLGESNKDECNVEEFSHILSEWTGMVGALETVKNLIGDLGNIFKTHFGISDAAEILNQKIRKEFTALKKVIEEMNWDLAKYKLQADSDGMIENLRGLLSASKIAKKHTTRFLEAKEAFIETLKETLKNTVVVLISEEDEKRTSNTNDFDSLFSSLKSPWGRSIAFKIKDLLFTAHASWKMRMTNKKVGNTSFEIPDSWKEDASLAFKKMIEDWDVDCFRKEIKELLNGVDCLSVVGKDLKKLYHVLKEMQHTLHERQTGGADEPVVLENYSEIEARFFAFQNDFLEVVWEALREDDEYYRDENDDDLEECDDEENNEESYEDDEEDEEYDEDSDDGEDDDEYEEEGDDDGEDEDEDEEDDAYVFCISCGARNPEGANFCYKCGEEIFRDED
ncbi:MAG: hypothetical protein J6L64_04180 [Opitutales bacterium]|nr:hypothetical protein [Opitutales bacterium]